MQSSWPMVRLGDLIEVKHGWPFKSELFSADAIDKGIVVAVGNFRYTGGFRFEETNIKGYLGDYPAEYELLPGDVLLVMTCQTAGGEILGIPARVPADGRKYLHNQRLGKVVVNRPDLVRLDYLYWLFLSPAFNRHLVATASGTKILHTSPSRICEYHFQLPSLDVQEEVAATLSALEDRLDALRRTNWTLEAIAQALFTSWFVRFDPVRVKADGREPDGIDHETATLFPDSFKDSELGLIPSGWTVTEVGSVVTVVGGSTPSTKEPSFWDPALFHWATPKDLSNLTSPVLLSTERKVSAEGLQKISSGLLPEGTLLMSSRAPIGYLALTRVPTAINQGFIAMPPGGVLPPEYLLFWAQLNLETIKQRANGSTFMEISKAAFRPIKVVVPASEIVTRFIEVTRPLLDRISANVAYSHSLEQLRNELLPRLISGQLRIHEAQQIAEEVLA